MNELGPEFSPLVREHARYFTFAQNILDCAVLLTAFERELKDEIRRRCTGTGNDLEVEECEG